MHTINALGSNTFLLKQEIMFHKHNNG